MKTCAGCDGVGVDRAGDVCRVCRGSGTYKYGENNPIRSYLADVSPAEFDKRCAESFGCYLLKRPDGRIAVSDCEAEVVRAAELCKGFVRRVMLEGVSFFQHCARM